jgi:hypothetical protein
MPSSQCYSLDSGLLGILHNDPSDCDIVCSISLSELFGTWSVHSVALLKSFWFHWFLGYTHKPTSQHLWLSLKGFLGLFETFVKILAHVLMILLGPHMGMHLVAVQTMYRLSFKRTNANEISNMLDTSQIMILLFLGEKVHSLINRCLKHSSSSTGVPQLLN